MGLLDDAIREHLDLKRRRGADPNEIDRLEREALGPVRRVQSEGLESAPLEEGEPGAVYTDDQPAEPWTDGDGEGSIIEHEADLAERRPLEDWDVPEREPIARREPGPVESGLGVEPDVAAPATPAPPSPVEPSDALTDEHYLEQETVEHDVEGERLDPESPEDDMLEETPEFLQDTPDHDRLWFEQRPPRDFDLDG